MRDAVDHDDGCGTAWCQRERLHSPLTGIPGTVSEYIDEKCAFQYEALSSLRQRGGTIPKMGRSLAGSYVMRDQDLREE